MKQKILEYLRSDRSFNSGVQLYHEFGKNLAFKRILNTQGYTDYNLRLLQEELRKLAGIQADEFKAIISAKLISKEVPAEVKQDPPTEDEIKVFRQQIPEHVRKTIRLRDDFPFLAKPDCPDEFKILVHDMLTAHEEYINSHKRLFDAVTGDQLQEIAASVVENYLENRLIWDELNYYKENGRILGKHPIFSTTDRMLEIRNMTTAEHVKLQKACINNIARTRKNIEKQPEHENNADRRQSIAQWEIELAEVNRILGL